MKKIITGMFFMFLMHSGLFAKENIILLQNGHQITVKDSDFFDNIKKSKEYKHAGRSVKKYIDAFLDLSDTQIEKLFKIYKKAEKYDLSLTLTAIAWKESLVGMIPINLFDRPWGSCGIFHANLKSVIGRHPELKLGKKPSKFQLNKLCGKLINNQNFAFHEAVAEINHWKKKFKKGTKYRWLKIWASYNAGTKYVYGMDYAKDLKNRIDALKIIADYSDWDNI